MALILNGRDTVANISNDTNAICLEDALLTKDEKRFNQEEMHQEQMHDMGVEETEVNRTTDMGIQRTKRAGETSGTGESGSGRTG